MIRIKFNDKCNVELQEKKFHKEDNLSSGKIMQDDEVCNIEAFPTSQIELTDDQKKSVR